MCSQRFYWYFDWWMQQFCSCVLSPAVRSSTLISTLTYLLEQCKEEDHLIIESDCLTLVESINDRCSSPWEIRAFVADASVLRRSFPRLRIQHCRREANAAADWAAKAQACKTLSPSWPNFPPAPLTTLLCIDALSTGCNFRPP